MRLFLFLLTFEAPLGDGETWSIEIAGLFLQLSRGGSAIGDVAEINIAPYPTDFVSEAQL